MKFFNKITILLILFVLSISATYATDNDSMDMAYEEDDPHSNINLKINEEITLENNNESNLEDKSNNFNISTKDLTMQYGDKSQHSVQISNKDKPVYNQSITFSINNVNYTKFTDENGIAFLTINLNAGNYSITTTVEGHPSIVNKITVMSTVMGNDITKIFKNNTQYYATFIGKDLKPLVNESVEFNINGIFYKKVTDENGTAKLNINLNAGTYIITTKNFKTNELHTNIITVLPAIHGKDLTKYYMNNTQYTANFRDANNNPLVNKTITFNVNGIFYKKITDENGTALLTIRLQPGTYIITAIHPDTCYMHSNRITVLRTIFSNNIAINEGTSSNYTIKLLNNENGEVLCNKNLIIKINDTTYKVKTNADGIATLKIENVKPGNYLIKVLDEYNNNITTNSLFVKAKTQYYSKYGVSPDEKRIICVGRATSYIEYSKYGYNFWKTEFERICPFCKSNQLYWSIFWAGNEYTNYGRFPVTGNIEGGSAEGHIFCAKCDADFGVIEGYDHGYVGAHLKKTKDTVKSSKQEAYLLKNGGLVYNG